MKIQKQRLIEIIREEITDARIRKKVKALVSEYSGTSKSMGGRTKFTKGPSARTTTAKTKADTARSKAQAAKTKATSAKTKADTAKATKQTKSVSKAAAKTTLDNAKSAVTSKKSAEPTKNETAYTYTNTVTGKKVTSKINPGSMGEYTIPAIGGGKSTSIDKSATDYWIGVGHGEVDAGKTEAKSHEKYTGLIDAIKQTRYKRGSREEQRQLDALKTLEKVGPEDAYEWNREVAGLRKLTIKKGEGGGKDETKFGTEKQYQSDVEAYEKKAGKDAKKVAFKKATVSKTDSVTTAWNTWKSQYDALVNAQGNAQNNYDDAAAGSQTADSESETADQEQSDADQEQSDADQEQSDADQEHSGSEEGDKEDEKEKEDTQSGGASGGQGGGGYGGPKKGKGKGGEEEEEKKTKFGTVKSENTVKIKKSRLLEIIREEIRAFKMLNEKGSSTGAMSSRTSSSSGRTVSGGGYHAVAPASADGSSDRGAHRQQTHSSDSMHGDHSSFTSDSAGRHHAKKGKKKKKDEEEEQQKTLKSLDKKGRPAAENGTKGSEFGTS